MNLPDLIGLAIGFTLTIMVISYIFGDNALVRLALHIFIGVSAGYAAVLVVYNVLWYQLLLPIVSNPLGSISLFIPLLLGVWMFTKASPRLARFGNPVMALLVGIGAASAIGGAVLGTIFSQVRGSFDLMDLAAAQATNQNLILWFFNAVVILLGTVTTLIFFHFGVRPARGRQPAQRHPLVEALSNVGQVFISITFGVLFAGVYTAALAALIERLYFIWDLAWVYVIGQFFAP